MSGRHPGTDEAYGCPHSKTIDDDREGQCVCIQCGLVLESIFQAPKNEDLPLYDHQQNIINSFLRDVGAHAEIPLSILQYAESYFQEIKNSLREKKKFKDKELASYALYETLHRHKIPRPLPEITYFCDINPTKLFAIETALNIRGEDEPSHPIDYSDRLCNLLGLSFCDSKFIKGIVFNTHLLSLGSRRPQSVVALVVYLYCQQNEINMSLIHICEICSVSSTNIYKLARNLQEPYKSKIMLLYF